MENKKYKKEIRDIFNKEECNFIKLRFYINRTQKLHTSYKILLRQLVNEEKNMRETYNDILLLRDYLTKIEERDKDGKYGK